jgi:hypothetical protein
MNRRPLVVCALAGLLLGTPGVSRAIDSIAARERIGVRVGGLSTNDGLNDAYGTGWEITLFFTEQITRPLLLDIRIGALYLGDLKYTSLDDELTGTPGVQGAMRVLYLSAGPLYGFPITDALTMFASAAAGIYSVSMVFDDGVSAFDFSDQQVGFNGGLGLVRRLSANWSIEASGMVHYFIVEEDINDLYYAFTDGADAPLILDIAVGFILDLR